MMERLLINLETLPEEGKSIHGQIDPGFFKLPSHDPQPSGPVEVQVYAQRFENELLLTGSAHVPFQFNCVGCLEDYAGMIDLPCLAIAHEIEQGGEIDLTDALREEILLEFPAHPRCDVEDPEKECIIDSRYLAVDKSPGDDVKTPPTPSDDDRWGALDALSDDLPESSDHS